MTVHRDLIETLGPFLKRREYLAITGPRQAGKTTLLSLLAGVGTPGPAVPAPASIVTFEDRRHLRQFEADPAAFVRSFAPAGRAGRYTLMLDEFQHARDGGQLLKLVYDTVPAAKLIVTGSSSLEPRAQTGRHLVGRLLNFNLLPFSFRECLRARHPRLARLHDERRAGLAAWWRGGDIRLSHRGVDPFREEFIPAFERYAVWGGYPAVVLARTDGVRRKLLAELLNSYLLKDIRTLLALATERNLELLARQLATQTGNLVAYQHLGQEAGLDYRNLLKHLTILRETYICREVRPYFVNRKKELVKNPKIYFHDPGFRNHLMENMNGLPARPDAGAMVENACWLALGQIAGDTGRVNFWRTKAGAEVDFVLHADGGIIPVEIKYTPATEEKVPRGLISFITAFQPKQAVVVTKDYWGRTIRDRTRILFVPAYYL